MYVDSEIFGKNWVEGRAADGVFCNDSNLEFIAAADHINGFRVM